jgi:hypothetical protein
MFPASRFFPFKAYLSFHCHYFSVIIRREIDGTYPDTSPVRQYMVVEEKDLDEMGQDENEDAEPPHFSPEKVNKMLQARREMIKELYLATFLSSRFPLSFFFFFLFSFSVPLFFLIICGYVPLHPHLYTISDSLFVPSFLDALKEYKSTNNKNKLRSIMTAETPTGIFSFDVFNSEFCR